MKNTKLTKDMKHNIAHAMYDVYHSKTINYWHEFIPVIQSCCPVVTQALHWNVNQIENNITDFTWFRHYVLAHRYH